MTKPTLACLQLDGTITQETWDDVQASVRRIKAFFAALRLRFIGRDALIDRIEYAVLRREHVLSYGDAGTGKTGITKQIVRGTEGMRSFSIGLTAETTEDKLFGDPDWAHWREHHEVRRQIEGSILDAHLVHLGEYLNAGVQLLEALNDFLEDRDYRHGKQVLAHCPMMTALADTNVDPIAAMEADDKLVPVIDRFMFLVPVTTLTQTEQLSRMLRLNLARERAKPLPPLTLEDLVRVSGVSHGSDLFDDPVIEQAYVELYQHFSEATGERVTNRTFCKIAELAEVEALMQGRQRVMLDDLRVTGLGLVRRDGEQEAFDEAIAKIVEGKWKQQEHRARVQAEEDFLNNMAGQIPSEEEIEEQATARFMSILQELKHVDGLLAKTTMTSQRNRDRHARLRADIEMRKLALFGRADAATDPKKVEDDISALLQDEDTDEESS